MEQWDLIIVDEAHRMGARYFGGKLEKTKRFQLGELLSEAEIEELEEELLAAANRYTARSLWPLAALIAHRRYYSLPRDGEVIMPHVLFNAAVVPVEIARLSIRRVRLHKERLDLCSLTVLLDIGQQTATDPLTLMRRSNRHIVHVHLAVRAIHRGEHIRRHSTNNLALRFGHKKQRSAFLEQMTQVCIIQHRPFFVKNIKVKPPNLAQRGNIIRP
nr:hypothetical protein [Frankia sp. CiP3]